MKVSPTLLTLTLCAVFGAAHATDVNSKVVKFTNGWQPGLDGTGEIRLTAADAQKPHWAIQFTFATQAVENNVGVTHRVMGIIPEPTTPEEDLFARLTGAVTEPDFLIAGDGRFVALKDLPGLRKALREKIRETFGRLNAVKSDPANFERFVERSTSQDLLEGRVEEDWNRMVSRWIGARLGVGKEYHFDETVTLPIPSRSLPKLLMHGTYTLTHLETCDRAAVARTCAIIQMHLLPDEADLTRVTQEVFAYTPKIGKEADDTPTMAVDVVAEIVTEPDGLIPHRYAITKKVDVTLSKDGKNSQQMLDKRETTLTYP
jgi:hypothetical protein